MWALPPGWRKWTRRRLPLIIGGAVVVVLSATLALHVLKDVVGVVHEELAPVHDYAPAPTPAATPAPHAPTARPPVAPPIANGPFVVRSILSIPGPIKFGQFYWDEAKGEPGPVVITVDLAARVLSVFENGHEVGASAILKGYGDKPTPVGVFPITQKDATHISNIFDVPMPWMLRLTNDGVSIHGSKVERGYATNGCIGVPDDFAEKLFRVAHLGDKVIITNGKQLKLGDPILNTPKT
jgi:lipoprotein-anchoring transpeptidase ErfK/SrfK